MITLISVQKIAFGTYVATLKISHEQKSVLKMQEGSDILYFFSDTQFRVNFHVEHP